MALATFSSHFQYTLGILVLYNKNSDNNNNNNKSNNNKIQG